MHKTHTHFPAIVLAAGLSLPAAALAAGNLGQPGMQYGNSQHAAHGLASGLASSTQGSNAGFASTTQAPKAKPLPARAVRTVQKALDRHGAKVKVNGMMDLKTIESLMKFQRSHNLIPTGFVNRKTATKLGIAGKLRHEGANLA